MSKRAEADPKGSATLDSYGEQIRTSCKTYEGSLKRWKARRKIFLALLQTWAPYPQLKENPIDKMRLELIDAEIKRQTERLERCAANLAKFEELQSQMLQIAAVAAADGVASAGGAHEEAMGDEDAIMEICEELDDDDNIISATVTPRDQRSVEMITGLMSRPSVDLESRSGGESTKELISGQATSCESHNSALAEIPDVEVGSTDITGTTNPGLFKVTTNAAGEQELVSDSGGFQISVLPPEEMNAIAESVDWDALEFEQSDGDLDEIEDEYGRTKSAIPIPALLQRPAADLEKMKDEPQRLHSDTSNPSDHVIADTAPASKKKLVFADNLVRGPTPSGTPTKSVLKKTTSYPLSPDSDSVTQPSVETVSEHQTTDLPKQSRFKMARSSTDLKIAARHAQPSQAYKAKLNDTAPMADRVVEKDSDDEGAQVRVATRPEPPQRTSSANLTREERDRLYPKKTNLASVDLDEEAGLVKREFSAPTLSPEALEAIRKKREALGKRHKRRKSADPSHPVRSSSFDEHGPISLHHNRSKSSTDLEAEHGEKLKEIRDARLQRAKEILKAQDDIKWANQPLTPDSPDALADVHELGAATTLDTQSGSAVPAVFGIKEDERTSSVDTPGTFKNLDSSTSSVMASPAQSDPGAKISPPSGGRTPPVAHGPPIVSPRATKPPTPERRSSIDRPSPLSNEIKPSVDRQVAFSRQVVERLAPLQEDGSEPTVVANLKSPRRMPPREPKRKPSIDPLIISPTPGSPPPENRSRDPLATEQEGAVHHNMVKATPRSPPPHIAIHDLVSEGSPTSQRVRLEMKREAATAFPPLSQGQSVSKPGETFSSTSGAKQSHSIGHSGKAKVLEQRHPDHGSDATRRGLVSDCSSSPLPLLKTESAELLAAKGGNADGIDGSNDSDDGYDEEMHAREVREAYHRLRSRMIQSHGGGFATSVDDDWEVYATDSADGMPRDDEELQRMSRWRSARMKPL
ncbi:hypothetical protein PYCC9005_002414 [Savitreella phatthalungensis]